MAIPRLISHLLSYYPININYAIIFQVLKSLALYLPPAVYSYKAIKLRAVGGVLLSYTLRAP